MIPSTTLESIVTKINGVLIGRKSSEVLDGNGVRPITTTPEAREIATQILHKYGVDTAVPPNILDNFVRGEGVDLRQIKSEVTAWDIYWALEMAAAQIKIAGGGGSYENFLPGRFMHYNLWAKAVSDLFNNDGRGIIGKKVLEMGSGSGLSLILLAQKGADAYGIDQSVVGNAFAEYLTKHFGEHSSNPLNVNLRKGDYFQTGFDSRSFDVVYNAGVAEHLDKGQMDTLLGEMVRITKPGGYVAVAVPNEKGAFYARYKATKYDLSRRYPALISMPADTRRNHHDIEEYMTRHGLAVVRKDGLQVAPSARIERGDIRPEHFSIFDRLPPGIEQQNVPLKVTAWQLLELMADSAFRKTYGWSLYYVGQKPLEPKPTA